MQQRACKLVIQTSLLSHVKPTSLLPFHLTNHPFQNKWEHLTERQLDEVMDHLHTLNDTTPKLRCNGKDGVDPNLIFGLDSTLFQLEESSEHRLFADAAHNEEVETVTILRSASVSSAHTDKCSHDSHDHTETLLSGERTLLTEELLVNALQKLPKESVWRVKGFVTFSTHESYILNWAFGRYDLKKWDRVADAEVKLTVMGERGDVRRQARKFALDIGATMH